MNRIFKTEVDQACLAALGVQLRMLKAQILEFDRLLWAILKGCLVQRIAARQPSPNPKETPMDWNRVQGSWKQLEGKVKAKWGKLTADDLTAINGRREELEGKI